MFARILLGSVLAMTLVAFHPAAPVNAQPAPIFGSGGVEGGAERKFLRLLEGHIWAGESVAQVDADPQLEHVFQSVGRKGERVELLFLMALEGDIGRLSQLYAQAGLSAQAAEYQKFLSLLQANVSACQQGQCPVSPF
ncbi:hypothetical protein [Methylocapsa acidiphila]|uniref:hypothetical protein n=1 Tax=Methylocapsa acidiphila TaxID=133552 RepID=UPI0012EC812C|nr:hypothetical protein [Methylocapsa acidiphila]